MKVTNSYSATIVLPSGQPLYEGQETDVPNWNDFAEHPAIAWYVAEGFLTTDGDGEEFDERAKLVADLVELGVEVDGRTGVKKLRAMLEEKLAEG